MTDTKYSDKFEGPIILAMSAIIVASIVGVIALNSVLFPDCRPSEYTYCGEPAVADHH